MRTVTIRDTGLGMYVATVGDIDVDDSEWWEGWDNYGDTIHDCIASVDAQSEYNCEHYANVTIDVPELNVYVSLVN